MNPFHSAQPGRERTSRRTPLAAAIALVLLSLAAPGRAAPAASHWAVVDLGTLGGAYSQGLALNASGQVTGYATTASNGTYAFLYSNGSMASLGSLGVDGSAGYGINAAGQVVGLAASNGGWTVQAVEFRNGATVDLGSLGGAYSVAYGINSSGQSTGSSFISGNTAFRAFLYSAGTMKDIGGLGGSNSYGFAINDAGQVAGASQTSGDVASHAFLWSTTAGAMDLGTLGGTNSTAKGINAGGMVTGVSDVAGATRAFLYRNGTMTDLGSLGSGFSDGLGINSAGQVVGNSSTASDPYGRAFLYSQGAMLDLSSVNGVAGSGWTLREAAAINDAGQITGTGDGPAGRSRAYLLTLDTTVWESGSSGTWEDASGWSFGIAPNLNTQVVIDPVRSQTVTGPQTPVTVRQLTIGGDATGNNGIATLSLNGGTISVLGRAGQFTTITAQGVLTGDGRLTGPVVNLGTVVAQNLALPGGLTNQGVITGSGRLRTSLDNTATGLLRVDGPALLQVQGDAHLNNGRIEARGGGEIQFQGALTNNGQVLADGGIVRFDSALNNTAAGRLSFSNASGYFSGGLSNAGQLQVTFGSSQIFGNIVTTQGGKIIFTGNSNNSFYDTVEVRSGGEMRVSAGSTAVFFGQVLQRTGAQFTGTGQSFYEGGLAIGNSPGLGSNAGSVAFGAGNVYVAEVGGTAVGDAQGNGIAFDRYVVAGQLTFGGTLQLTSWAGFTGQAGQSVDLFDWGSTSGRFNTIDASGLQLAAGTRLDLSNLYVDGTVRVSAVPEPMSWALWCGGLGLLTALRRRRSPGAAARPPIRTKLQEEKP
jgi:probable HAF family extracellular repeat protein